MKPERESLSDLLARLSERERQVLEWSMTGASNRETARALGISPRTVEVFKSRMLVKMRADSLAELRERLGET